MYAIFLLFNLPRRTWWLLGAMCVLHGVLGATLGLSVDEAHYALYAAHLDWSYFDHPPLVGWFQWFLVALNAPVWMLRLLPELLWFSTALLSYALAEHLAPPTLPQGAAGFWAIAALALAPLFHILGIGLLPDTLLVFFTLVVMILTQELMQPESVSKIGLWVALGIALGLAGLSKYTAIFAALAVALCLFSVHGGRLFRQNGLWLALALALLLVLPVAYWNATHDWISFRYQAAHGAGGGWNVLHIVRFLVIQVVVYGALLLWGFKGVFGADGVAPKYRMLLAFFAIPFTILAYLSGGGTSLPHWTAPAWIALLPFAGVGLARSIQQVRIHYGIAACSMVQAGISLSIVALLFTGGQPFITNTYGEGNNTAPSNPFADVYGWEEAGKTAKTLAAQQHLPSIVVQNWTLASRLAWYARPLPVQVLADGFDQFTLWSGKLPKGGNALLVRWSQLTQHDALPFADCRLLTTQTATRFGEPLSEFRFYACHDYHP